jgi:hypothetical protein
MTIETQFDLGDTVKDKKDNEGVVDQVLVQVMYVGTEPFTQISYKVNFNGIVKSVLEADLV